MWLFFSLKNMVTHTHAILKLEKKLENSRKHAGKKDKNGNLLFFFLLWAESFARISRFLLCPSLVNVYYFLLFKSNPAFQICILNHLTRMRLNKIDDRKIHGSVSVNPARALLDRNGSFTFFTQYHSDMSRQFFNRNDLTIYRNLPQNV